MFHAATLHKPHIATHSRQDFVDTNITGTLLLLEEAATAGVESFVYTSPTSVFGDALGAARRFSSRMGDGRYHAYPQEHLWGDQGGGGGPFASCFTEIMGSRASCCGHHDFFLKRTTTRR